MDDGMKSAFFWICAFGAVLFTVVPIYFFIALRSAAKAGDKKKAKKH